MDKTIAAIKICAEFIIGAIFYCRMAYNEEHMYPMTSYILSLMFFVGMFEVVFYWHALR